MGLKVFAAGKVAASTQMRQVGGGSFNQYKPGSLEFAHQDYPKKKDLLKQLMQYSSLNVLAHC